MSADAERGSPRILAIEWGRMEVEGLPEGKDFMLYPGGGRPWDWNATGTRHHPGIQVADIEALIERGAEVVILSRGMDLRLETAPETVAFLEASGLDFHIEQTEEAVRRYNALAGHRSVGGLFHSTC